MKQMECKAAGGEKENGVETHTHAHNAKGKSSCVVLLLNQMSAKRIEAAIVECRKQLIAEAKKHAEDAVYKKQLSAMALSIHADVKRLSDVMVWVSDPRPVRTDKATARLVIL